MPYQFDHQIYNKVMQLLELEPKTEMIDIRLLLVPLDDLHFFWSKLANAALSNNAGGILSQVAPDHSSCTHPLFVTVTPSIFVLVSRFIQVTDYY